MSFRLFGRGKQETVRDARPTITHRVTIEGYRAPLPPPAPRTVVADPLKQRLIFNDLHEDVNPSEHVRTGNMTCPACTTSFRYFKNSDGKTTVMRCPGCGKQYRV